MVSHGGSLAVEKPGVCTGAAAPMPSTTGTIAPGGKVDFSLPKVRKKTDEECGRSRPWLPLWGSWHRRKAVTLRPQARFGAQPPKGRLLARR